MAIEHRLHARCGCGHVHAAESSSLGGAAGRPFPFASSPRNYERSRPFAVDKLSLVLALDVAKKSVRGTATLDVVRKDPNAEAIALDAIAFQIESVRVDGKSAPYEYDGNTLTVQVGKKGKSKTVSVSYEATPRRGLYFLEPDEHYPNRPNQVWSQCQEEDARHFIPCHDKPHVKMRTELNVLVPKGWYALSNGELVSRKDEKNGSRFHWKFDEPHPSYLMTLAAGEFSELRDKAGSVPLSYLVPKGREADAKRTFARTKEMIRHFGDVLGVPYPWSRYAQIVVSDFIFGGMENTTATTLYEHVILDARAEIDVTSDDLIAHELAHQWFGDYVTCRDWSEGWLNEGFATYFEHVWREHHLGKDEYEYGIKVDLDSYLGEAHGRYRRPIVCVDYDSALDLFDRHLYEKGGLVLHTLRQELGTDLFFKGVNLYLKRHAKSIVETRDLLRAFEEVSGRSLAKTFDQGVFRAGHPELDVNISFGDGVLSVQAKQTHGTGDNVPAVFELPLVLDIAEKRGVRRVVLDVTQKTETFTVPCAERPKFVVVDPEMRILGSVSVKAPSDMMRAQAKGAKSARGRWLAVDALSSSDDSLTIACLAERLADEKEFWGVRANAAEALGKIRTAKCEEILIKHASTKHPKVRRAVQAGLGRFRTSASAATLKSHALSDKSYLVQAEAARALGRTRQDVAFEPLVELLDRPSWADVITGGAIDGLAQSRDERALPHLYARAKYGHPQRARRAAILALPKIASDRKAREFLEEQLDDNDPIVRIDVVRALDEMGDIKSRGALRARLGVDLDARVRRRIREALRDIGADTKKGAEEMRGELEKLETAQRDLKTRVQALEAKLRTKKKK